MPTQSDKLLRVSVLGGLGTMASPMATHWQDHQVAQVMCVHDRGTQSDRHEAARAAWRAHGARLVDGYEALVDAAHLDGVIVCCGKNGDDAAIIGALARQLTAGKFICHLSTVSARFVQVAQQYCAQHHVVYVNYPLTGGPIGAQQASMLILASGDKPLFDRMEPALAQIGRPRYFGESITAGAEVKLMGQLMVFNALFGLCSAAAIHTQSFQNGSIGGADQAAFFDFLNTGAGGSRQWDVALSHGIRNDVWDAGFSLRYAVADVLYAADLCAQHQVSFLAADAMIQMALCFSFILQEIGSEMATQSLMQALVAERKSALEQFVLAHAAPRDDVAAGIARCLQSLPKAIRESTCIAIEIDNFQ